MIKRITIGDLRLTFTAARIVKVGGFNSLLADGNHILMWDFDDIELLRVKGYLCRVQYKYQLPRIYVLETRASGSYIAYCFKRTPWKKAVIIVADTPEVDWNFLKYGVYRDKFTLRATDKGYGKPHCVAVLESNVPEDATILDLATWVRYETLKNKKSLRLKR
uniref:Uncharacterized protein n=1 Tax=viral metagenome TaxID=1070528 RepID=A0A6M3M9P6_9ZZZZ